MLSLMLTAIVLDLQTITKSSAYRTRGITLSGPDTQLWFSSMKLSRLVNATFANKGEIIPPCGVPVSLSNTSPL